MNELLSKLSSYNLFNYLLVGVIFTVIASDAIRYPISQQNIFVAVSFNVARCSPR